MGHYKFAEISSVNFENKAFILSSWKLGYNLTSLTMLQIYL